MCRCVASVHNSQQSFCLVLSNNNHVVYSRRSGAATEETGSGGRL